MMLVILWSPCFEFQSTLSVRRATVPTQPATSGTTFQSTLSVRRATEEVQGYRGG